MTGKRKVGLLPNSKGNATTVARPGTSRMTALVKGRQTPVGNVDQKPPRDQSKKDWCKYCLRGPPKEEDCYSKKGGKPPHPGSKCAPSKPVQAAGMGGRATNDMTQEQLSTLFTELVAGTKVLPIGVVSDVPVVLPVAHAPTLRDAESQ